jgi:hypothetical protein
MSVILVLSFPLPKALLILYSKIALIWGQFHFGLFGKSTAPIIGIVRYAVLVQRGSGGSSLVPCTITPLSLQ